MKCNKCNNEVADGAKFCANCGNNVEWQTMSLDEMVQAEPACPEMTCPHCANVIDSQSVFCGACGKNVSESAESMQEFSVPEVPVCEKCATPLVEGAAFCGGCGNAIGAGNVSEEYTANVYNPPAEEPAFNSEAAFQYNGGYVEPAMQENTDEKQGMDKGIIILLAILAVAVIVFAVVIVTAFNIKPSPAVTAPDVTDARLLKSSFAFIKAGVLK